MQRSKIVKYLDSLTPETDFKTLLETKFDIGVPVGAPRYQVEYLYKCLLVEQANGTKHSDMLVKAKQHFDELLNKFPWLATSEKIKTVIVKDRVQGALPTKDKVPDGTVAYCIRRE